MTLASIRQEAAEKYPMLGLSDYEQEARQEGYVQGRLDQVEADAQTARKYSAKFDRRLPAHDSEVAAKALEEAVEIVSSEERAFVTSEWGTVVRKLTIMDALRARAAEYRNPEGNEG